SNAYRNPQNLVTGWVRSTCPASNHDRTSEYDWLTFLWAMNGVASGGVPVSGSLTMQDMFTVFGNVSQANFTHANLLNKVNLNFGSLSVQALRYNNQALANGVTY